MWRTYGSTASSRRDVAWLWPYTRELLRWRKVWAPFPLIVLTAAIFELSATQTSFLAIAILTIPLVAFSLSFGPAAVLLARATLGLRLPLPLSGIVDLVAAFATMFAVMIGSIIALRLTNTEGRGAWSLLGQQVDRDIGISIAVVLIAAGVCIAVASLPSTVAKVGSAPVALILLPLARRSVRPFDEWLTEVRYFGREGAWLLGSIALALSPAAVRAAWAPTLLAALVPIGVLHARHWHSFYETRPVDSVSVASNDEMTAGLAEPASAPELEGNPGEQRRRRRVILAARAVRDAVVSKEEVLFIRFREEEHVELLRHVIRSHGFTIPSRVAPMRSYSGIAVEREAVWRSRRLNPARDVAGDHAVVVRTGLDAPMHDDEGGDDGVETTVELSLTEDLVQALRFLHSGTTSATSAADERIALSIWDAAVAGRAPGEPVEWPISIAVDSNVIQTMRELRDAAADGNPTPGIAAMVERWVDAVSLRINAEVSKWWDRYLVFTLFLVTAMLGLSFGISEMARAIRELNSGSFGGCTRHLLGLVCILVAIDLAWQYPNAVVRRVVPHDLMRRVTVGWILRGSIFVTLGIVMTFAVLGLDAWALNSLTSQDERSNLVLAVLPVSVIAGWWILWRLIMRGHGLSPTSSIDSPDGESDAG